MRSNFIDITFCVQNEYNFRAAGMHSLWQKQNNFKYKIRPFEKSQTSSRKYLTYLNGAGVSKKQFENEIMNVRKDPKILGVVICIYGVREADWKRLVAVRHNSSWRNFKHTFR